MTLPTRVEITPKGFDYIKHGGLWIFANEFKTKMKDLKKGEWVEFYFKNEFVGYGYVNPNSLIAGRICSFKKVTDRRQIFLQLMSNALKKRQSVFGKAASHNTPLYQKPTDAFRAVFAESDQLPGLIIDVYGNTVVAQSSTAGIDTALDDLISVIEEIFKPQEFVFKAESSMRHLEGVDNFIKIIQGKEDHLRFGKAEEEGLLIACDFIEGQKTGFFIDQKDNRKKLKELAKGKKVLDLCCYSGGWGLSTLKAGAENVVFVDQSKEAIELVKRGLELNHFDIKKAELIIADVFEYLQREHKKFDIIICDPPAFVKSKKNLPQAERAYLKLNTEAIKKLSPGGILATCSCSYHMSQESFTKIVAQAFAQNNKTADVIYQGTQSLDHPWVINRPESHYLKCLFLRMSNEN